MIFWRNLLLRTFLIGVGFAILLFVVIYFTRPVWETLTVNLFGVEKRDAGILALDFFMNIRLVLVFIILSPALALHWMIKKSK